MPSQKQFIAGLTTMLRNLPKEEWDSSEFDFLSSHSSEDTSADVEQLFNFSS